MTKDVTKSLTRRTVIGGVAGMAVIAMGATSLAGSLGRSSAATMPPTAEATVAHAISAAEAEHAAAVAAAEAERAAALAAAEEERLAREAAAAARAAKGQSVADVAKAQAGDSYRRGGSGPSVFDCSGLVKYAYQQALGVSLPHNTRAQWNAISDTWHAGEKDPQPGDVVFFFRNGADHVGLYIGNGKMVSAENPRSGVKIVPVFDGYWGNKLTGFGRVAG